jgi:hypothetical protein
VNPTAFKVHERKSRRADRSTFTLRDFCGILLLIAPLKYQISKDGFKATITTKHFSPKQAGVG